MTSARWHRPSRRDLFVGAGAALVLAGCSDDKGGGKAAAPSASRAPSLAPLPAASPIPGVGDDAFALGVASGDPLPDSVILWTRLAPKPTEGGGMPARAVPVQWEIAEDEAFRRVVARGQQTATPEGAHSVHVDARGLSPARGYFYRFRAGTALSPVGRTRTAPAAGATPARLRLAVANCQDFQNGYWPAYTAMAREDLDLVVHVGDYIYEYDPDSRFRDRRHTTPQTPGRNQLSTLADYRDRYGQYKSDPALQATHHAFPWVVTWDDHEVENNYAGLIDEVDDKGAKHQDPAAFARQRAAAYQAYYEHMPIRAALTPGSPDLKIYRRFRYGDLVTLNIMDTRQYRTDQPCGRPVDFGPASCGDDNTAGTMSGSEQEQWLKDGLSSSRTRWNVIAQQTMMARLRFALNNQTYENLDQNDGYGAYRTRLLSTVRDSKVANPVVLSGDIHSTWVNDLRADFDKPETPAVATEFVSTSISSAFFLVSNDFIEQQNRMKNPHVRYFDGTHHGYPRIEIGRDRLTADLRVARTIETRDAPVTTAASFAVENGRPGAQRT